MSAPGRTLRSVAVDSFVTGLEESLFGGVERSAGTSGRIGCESWDATAALPVRAGSQPRRRSRYRAGSLPAHVACTEVFDRVSWWKDAAWLLPALYMALAALLLTAVFWPITAIVRRRFSAPLALGTHALRAYRFSKIGSISLVAGLGLWALTIVRMSSDVDNLGAKFDANLRFTEAFGVMAFVVGSALILWNLWIVWTGAPRRWPAKVWSIALTLSAFVVLWFAFAFNLIGFSVNY